MRALITGGGGFIGSHLVDSQLSQGHLVRTVDLHVERLAHARGHPNLEVVVGDVTDPALVGRLVEGIDTVYHLASAHLDVSLSDDDYRRVNVDAAIGLLKAARAAGVSRVVHCSSTGVIGDVKKPPADESTACDPTNVYERTKLAGERAALAYAAEADLPVTKLAGERAALAYAAETDLPVVVARPAWVYGPRCPRTEKLFRTIGRRRFVIFGDGRTLRHPIYVADAVRGLELCAENGSAPGNIYILAGEEPVTIETLVTMIADVMEVRPPTLHLPVFLGTLAGQAIELAFRPLGRRPPVSRRTIDFFLKDNAYDISKARHELGFQPQVDLRDGLVETLNWLRNRETMNVNNGADGTDYG
jgi:nucleoside-diphosphate-sugar epimerase